MKTISTNLCAVLAILLALSGCNTPNVDPAPNDDDKTSGLVLVVLDDANTRTAETGKIVSDDQFWQKIRAEGHGYRFVDANNPSAAPFKADAEKAGMPALLIYKASKMKLAYAGKLPTETKLIDDLVSKYGGKKARGPPVHVDSTGEVRRLGLIPPDAKAKARRMKLQGFGAFLETKGMKLIPAEQWREIDYPRFHKPEFVLNQQQTSGCVGFSAAAANMKIRALRGMTPERLSGAFVYSLINGGRDAGAMIDDSRLALTKYGVCLDQENPLPNIYWRQVSESAKQSALNRQMTLAYRIENINELATALQLGLIVQAGVQVDGNFESFDQNGISRARGRYANHSIHIYGMKQIDGKWVYRMGNTWGATWGPFKDGSCFLRPEGIIIEGDAFVHADSEWLPDDLPTPKRDIQPLSVMEISEGKSNAKLADSKFVLAQ